MTAPVLIAADVGNSNTVLGIYRGDELWAHWRLSTDEDRTADEYGALLLPLFDRAGVDPTSADGVVIASVVPPLNPTLLAMSRRFFGVEPLLIRPGIRTGISIRSDDPGEVGADRIVNSLAALDRYGAPVVVVDFGTATTFDVVNAAGDYAGGIIAPGIGISSEALFSRASRLYRVDVLPPPRLVGTNTAGAMQSGIYYGYIGLVDGILARLEEEIPDLSAVVATGGFAEMIAEDSIHITHVDRFLTLHGLKLLYERNR